MSFIGTTLDSIGRIEKRTLHYHTRKIIIFNIHKMTPKEKAEELVDKYRNAIMSFLSDNMKDANAKKCAAIAVDEILNEISPLDIHPLGTYTNQKIDYWQQVKQELEKL